MTKQELLKKYYDEACHNLLCYSTNYLMDKPRKGYEKEWKETKVEVELLEEMMKQLLVDREVKTNQIITIHLTAEKFIGDLIELTKLINEVKVNLNKTN